MIWLLTTILLDPGYNFKITDYYLERHLIKLLLLYQHFRQVLINSLCSHKTTFRLVCCMFLLLKYPGASGSQSLFTPSDTFNRTRFFALVSGGALAYGATIIGLHEAWYRNHDQTSFHFFNDRGEWNNLDKAGHLFTAYFETEISFQGLRWTGTNQRKAAWFASGLGLFYQSTIEMFDAYSSRWGFSIHDMLYNVAGVGLFTGQQLLWGEQRVRMKVSSWPQQYPKAAIPAQNSGSVSSLKKRTDDLFGTNFLERYLKDYNAQTIWISINPKSFLPQSKIPNWLNIAIGYGSQNLFGGFSNTWSENGSIFSVSGNHYPRQRQWYLSPDIDFKKIPANRPFLKTVFTVLNIFKIPAPAIEYNSSKKWKWHWFFL